MIEKKNIKLCCTVVHADTYSGDGRSVIIIEGDDVLSDEGGGRGGASDGDISSLLIVEGVTSRSSSLVG